MNRIFLIGYMGSGKTTIGKLVAEHLGCRFIDMDIHIEQQQFKTVSQIFAEKGEDEFRKLEQQCLHEVADFENVVIATGGGTPCFFDNMDYMNRSGITIYLKLSPTELADRLELIGGNTRPLLANRTGDELKLFIAEGLAKREPYYEQAAFAVSGDIDQAAARVISIATGSMQ